jgi:MFS family permease
LANRKPVRADLPAATAPIWANRPFLLLWTAQAISQTAQNAAWYGILVLVQHKSQSSAAMSAAIVTLIVPAVLFGVVAGAMVDRWDKRWVLVLTNLVRGTVAFGYVLFGDVLPLVFLVNFLFATIGQFFAPAEAATIPAIVPRRQLLQANSLFHLTFTASQLVGLTLLGPLAARLIGVDGLFSVVAVLIVLCGLLVWPLPAVPPVASGAASAAGRAWRQLWQDVREVAEYVATDRTVLLAVAHWNVGAILGIVVAALAPAFVVGVLDLPAEDAVYVLLPAGLGMVVGTALLTRLGPWFDRYHLINGGLIVVSAALLLMGAVGPVWAFLYRLAARGAPFLLPVMDVLGLTWVVAIAGPLAGAGFVAIIVPAQTILQERVPIAIRARVFAVQLMVSNLLSVLPALFLGGLADLIGVARTLVLIGVMLFAIAAASIRLTPHHRPT